MKKSIIAVAFVAAVGLSAYHGANYAPKTSATTLAEVESITMCEQTSSSGDITSVCIGERGDCVFNYGDGGSVHCPGTKFVPEPDPVKPVE